MTGQRPKKVLIVHCQKPYPYPKAIPIAQKPLATHMQAEREERSIPEINLWGIWEQYRQPEETGAEVPEQTNISFLD